MMKHVINHVPVTMESRTVAICTWLRLRFENQVEGRLGCAAEACETAAKDDFAQARFAGLRAERRADFLGQ